ncbi:MAG: type I DNA topoisomerase [Polyangiaceae bacterium]
MGKTLVVVESPAKAKTIKKYLGANFEVMASKGHIKDLPKKMGIDIEKGFVETYDVIEGKEKVVAELKGAAKDAEQILLATDPDREGEAIAFHIAEELKSAKKKTARVEFHEITKKGVQYGVDHPRELNKHLYDAQRCRRILDRIVGYDVSALVWSKLAFGLSAGRVQSVALRLIVDREREIEAFVPEEYWNCGVGLVQEKTAKSAKKNGFIARLVSRGGEKLAVTNGTDAGVVRTDLESATFKVAKIGTSERKRKAPAPYTTSKLQQDAVNRLGFGAKRTMQVAQGLYEGVDLGKDGGPVGLITYMRTDSTRSSPEAIQAVRDYVTEKYGKSHVPDAPNAFKSKKNSQDAHEAIRPTSLELTPESVRKHLKDEQFKLYTMIWNRFVASQMKDAIYDQTSIDIEATASNRTVYGLRTSGRVLKFAGWLEAYGQSVGGEKEQQAGEEEEPKEGAEGPTPKVDLEAQGEDATLPELKTGEVLLVNTPPGVITEQKFTQPPARYTEGSLVRELEERGIGRPSTYAEIISKVQARDYVEKVDGGRSFRPTTLGKYVVDGLVKSELDFMEPEFTSQMEEQLDAVEAGTEERVVLLSKFYKRFREQLDKGKKGARWNPDPVPTTEKCDACGTGELWKRWSKNGWFLGCTNYPKCKNTRDLGPDGNGPLTGPPVKETGIACDKCGKPMVIKTGRYGEFLSCTGYPTCKNARPVPLGVPCPKCGGDIIEIRPKKKGGRIFYGCSKYADEAVKCDFKIWAKPLPEPCPLCKAPFIVLGGTKAKPMIACADKECGYKREVDTEPAPAEPTPTGGGPSDDDAAA